MKKYEPIHLKEENGFYLVDNFVLRDPEWRDVVKMFLDWWNHRPFRFWEANITIQISGEKSE